MKTANTPPSSPGKQDGHPFPSGTRIKKINSEPLDAHPDGARGTVIGSVGPVDHNYPDKRFAGGYGYFVEWDDEPGKQKLVFQNRISKTGSVI